MQWEKEKIYFEGDAYFKDLISDLRQAKKWVEIETYILEKDQIAQDLFFQLKILAQRGVQIRMIIDGIGSNQWDELDLHELKNQGLQIKVYNPLPWRIFYFLGRIRFKKFLYWVYSLFILINKRDHRKYYLIDHQIAYLGSINISQVHSQKLSTGPAWRDIGVRVEGSALKLLELAFEKIWRRNKLIILDWRPFTSKINMKHSLLHLNRSRKNRSALYHLLLEKISHAKESIYLTTPYFIPPLRLFRLLRKKSKEGVDVKILLPYQSDVPIVKWVSTFFYPELLKDKVEIYEFTSSILHAKSYLIDSWAKVGSTNLNSRSLLHDLELDVVITDKNNILKLRSHFLEDIKNSRVVKWEEIEKTPILFRLVRYFFSWFSYWY